MKKILIAGTHSGVGKTTVSLGLMKALTDRGKKVQPFKVGPDYIDPNYHKYVTGIHSRNLDAYMLDEEQIKYIFLRAANQKDISIIEGVMGLYDGVGSDINKCSTSAMAKVLKCPVILVIDAKATGASAAATVLGYKHMDKSVDIVGVIVNNIKNPNHYKLIKAAIEKYCAIEVLGYLPPNDDVVMSSRHLGLVQCQEDKDLSQKVDKMAQLIEKYVDVDRILELAESESITSSFEMTMFLDDPEVKNLAIGKKIGIAYDEAFNFYYQDNLDLLRDIGAELVFFSPIRDEKLPEIDLFYIGGGYPEIYAQELESNNTMLDSIREFYEANKPIYAECGGLMYLGKYLIDKEDNKHQMVGILDGYSQMTQGLKRFGYCLATAKEDNLISYKGQQLRGHEFHYSEFISDMETIFDMKKTTSSSVMVWSGGYSSKNVLASYLHVHFYNNLSIVCYLLSNTEG